MSQLKFPKKGAVARLREFYYQRRAETLAKIKQEKHQTLQLTNRTVNGTID